MLTIATWNVNSIRARVEHLKRWLEKRRPGIVCLQETKVTNADFPFAEIEPLGYFVVHAGGKGRNGSLSSDSGNILRRTYLRETSWPYAATST